LAGKKTTRTGGASCHLKGRWCWADRNPGSVKVLKNIYPFVKGQRAVSLQGRNGR
jgi:hypothetical protein